MPRQRPVLVHVGAVACLGLLLVAGCGPGPVRLDSPPLSGKAADACARLVAALPDAVADQDRRPVEPEQAYGAAWGDPAIRLRCGVPRPAGFDRFATCMETNGVGWFIPEEQITGRPGDIVMTTIGYAQNIEVWVPQRYWPPAAAMADLAPAIKGSIREVKPCV
jgi:hypothetical protein